MKLSKYLFIFICFIPLLLFRDFTPNNELKYLSIADEALREGHFFTFWNHGEIYADKPPLYLWIVMLGKWLLGYHSMLFLSLFSLLPALIIVYIMNKWVSEQVNPAFRSGGSFMLMSSGLFAGSVLILRMDMLMCMFIVLALYTFYRLYMQTASSKASFLLPFYIFMAIFTKGPVGILVPLLSIPVFLFFQGKLLEFGKYLGWKQFGILLCLCAIWFGGVYWEGGYAYLNNLLFHQTVNRAIDSFHHKEPVWYYLKTIWYSLAPWILLYLTAIFSGFRRHLFREPLKQLFLIIITTTFIALSVFSGKLDIYLLPIFPFIAYLALLCLPEIPENRIRFTVIIPAVILLFTFPSLFVLKKYISLPVSGTPVIPVAAFVLSASAAITLYFLYKKQLLRSIKTLSCGILLTLFTGGFAMPALNPYIGLGELCRVANRQARQNGITNYYYYDFRSGQNMDAYLGQEVPSLALPVIDSLVKHENFILFIKQKELNKHNPIPKNLRTYNTYRIGEYCILEFKSKEK